MKVEPMKISRYFLFLIFVSAMLGCQKDNTTAVGPPATENDINAASPETAAVEFVIDVRTQEEWDKGHLEQAIRIPHTEVSERIGEVTEDKSAKLVLYWQSGGRAGRAKEALEKMGYTNVENGGGFEELKDRYKQ
jgi:phage shock protein E